MPDDSDSAAPDDSDPLQTTSGPQIDRSFLDAAIDDGNARGFVAVGGGPDRNLRYITGFDGPCDHYAYLRVAGEDVLCPPREYADRAARQFNGRVETAHTALQPGERAAAVLDDLVDQPTDSDGATVVRVPPTIPHDAAVYLERAGYELRSTTAIAEARASKTAAELDAIRRVQRAAEQGVRRGERILAAAASDSDGGSASGLRWNGEPLTDKRLRREVNAELARHGVTDAANTTVEIGAEGSVSSADRVIHRDEAVVIDVAPRGPRGYHGALSWTFVVDSDGGWERRAYVACEAALEAALGELEPGVEVAAIEREAVAELAAFGFDPTGGDDQQPNPDFSDVVHGVGCSRRERPRSNSGSAVDVGSVLAISPTVFDAEHGTVRLNELVVITADGYERVGDGTASFTPRA